MTYKAIIFDLFHTLVDGFSQMDYENMLDGMAEALSLSRDELQRGWSDTSYERATGILPTIEANILHICSMLGVVRDKAVIDAAVEKRIALTRRALRPRADAIETLSELRKSALKIGLISNCSPDVPPLWESSELVKLIDEAILSCEVSLKKPDPKIYLLVCDRLAVSPEDCLYVGDGDSHELTGAARVGMNPVQIRVPYEDPSDAARGDVDDWEGPTISALSELPHLVFAGKK